MIQRAHSTYLRASATKLKERGCGLACVSFGMSHASLDHKQAHKTPNKSLPTNPLITLIWSNGEGPHTTSMCR
jgi:hypothetical protein